jgi:hypothetical protein
MAVMEGRGRWGDGEMGRWGDGEIFSIELQLGFI